MDDVFEVVIWKNGTRITGVKVCAENVNVNDLVFTLASFDRAVREKKKDQAFHDFINEYNLNDIYKSWLHKGGGDG